MARGTLVVKRLDTVSGKKLASRAAVAVMLGPVKVKSGRT
jgi:hypothetical protein